jgi:hypothetical protein
MGDSKTESFRQQGLEVEKNAMRRLGLLAACWAIMILWEGVSAFASDFDIAPFARRCCAADRHTSQVAFDYAEAQRAGLEAEKSADGRYVYGLQWAATSVKCAFNSGRAMESNPRRCSTGSATGLARLRRCRLSKTPWMIPGRDGG